MDEILHALHYHKTSLFKLFFCVVLLTFNVVKSEANPLVIEKCSLLIVDKDSSKSAHANLVADPSKSLLVAVDPLTITLVEFIPIRKCTDFIPPRLSHDTAYGHIEMIAYGGILPYEYRIIHKNNGIVVSNITTNVPDFDNLNPGTYTISVRDGNGDEATFRDITIERPTALEAKTTARGSNLSCFGDKTGTLTTNVIGGTPPYYLSYTKNSGDVVDFPTSSNDVFILPNLGAGVYALTIKDENGCKVTLKTETFRQPDPIVPSVAQICNGEGLPTDIAITAIGGVEPYEYSLDGINFVSTNTYPIPSTNPFTVHVRERDNNSCVVSEIVTLAPLEISFQNIDPQCSSAVLEIDVLNGTNPYVFTYSTGGTVEYMDPTPINLPTIFNINNLNNYTIAVTDANGCKATTTFEPDVFKITVKPTDIKCRPLSLIPLRLNQDLFTGSIEVETIDGKSPFTYELYKDGTIYGTYTEPFIKGLDAGIYSVVVTDDNGCTANADNIEILDATVGPLNTFTSMLGNISCNGDATGALEIATDGANLPLTFSINGNLTTPTTSTDPIYKFTNLKAGNYSILVTDANGCTFVDEGNISEPSKIVFSVDITNVKCKDGTTGQLVVKASGGTGDLEYIISKDEKDGLYQPSNIFSNLMSGFYKITVRDKNECTESLSEIYIEEPDPLSIGTVTTTSATCATDGTVTIIGTSGGKIASNYSFELSSTLSSTTFSNTTGVFTKIPSGTYTLKVTDDNGCVATAPVSVSSPLTPIINVNSTVNVLCTGGNTGSFIFDISNALKPFSIIVKDKSNNIISTTGSNPYTALGLVAGTYSISVTDFASCTATQNVVITEPTQLIIADISSTPTCPDGSPTGTVSVNVGGGTPPYAYSINGGTPVISSLNTYTFTSIGAGNSTVLVEDANKCMQTRGVTVITPASAIFIVSKSDASCFGGNDGRIVIYDNFISVGGQLQFSTDGGATFQTYIVANVPLNSNSPTPTVKGFVVNNLPAGNYSIILKGKFGNQCSLIINTGNGFSFNPTISVSQPNALTLNNTFKNVKCKGGATGSITVTASGGTGTYQYSKDGINYQASNTFTGLIAGTYKITVRYANSCTAVLTQTISEPTDPLSITSLLPIKPLCKGSFTGQLVVTAMGGTGAYQYSKDGINYQPSNVFDGLLSSIKYTITVKDANGCTATMMQTIPEPTNPLIVNSAVLNYPCPDGFFSGQMTVDVSGGLPPYSFSIDGGNNYVTGSSPFTFTKLPSFSHTVLIKDGNGCVATATATADPIYFPRFSVFPTNITCFGSQDGRIVLHDLSSPLGTQIECSTDNGVTFKTYIIQEVPLSLFGTPNFVKGFAIENLSAGTYPLIIRGANNGCRYLFNTNLGIAYSTTVTINDVKPIKIIFTPKDVVCKGDASGQLAVDASGGSGSTKFSIDGINYINSNVFFNLKAGTYTVTAKDIYGCSATATQTISEPVNPFDMILIPINVRCKGDATGELITIQIDEKTPVQYSINGSPFKFSNLFSSLKAGTYTITAQDANGCISTKTAKISEPIKPLTLSLASLPTNIKCKGEPTGKIDVMPMGGTAPYSYVVNGTAFASTPFNDLPAKPYVINVIDNNGCTLTTPLNVTLTEPTAPLSISDIPTEDVRCKGDANGSITIKAKGGTVEYMYSIDNGATFQPSNVFNNLLAKIYKVVVKDANDCITPAQDVEIKEPDLKLDLALTNKIDLDCVIRTGSATLAATGGAGAYTYKLGSVTQTTTTFANLAAGNYIVSVTDVNNCLATRPLSILDNKTNPNAPNALLNITLCKSEQVTLTPTGSTGTYNFYDKNPVTNIGLTPLATNIPTYTFTPTINTTIWITAVTGVCESTPIAVTITILEPLRLSAIPTKPLCPNGMDGKIDLTITGGITPYIINWTGPNSFVSTNEDLTGLKAGTYTVEVGLNGFTCKETLQVVVPEGMDMTPPTIKTKDLTVYLDAQGKATITVLQLDNGTTDNCSLQSIAIDKNTFMCGQVGPNTVVFTATDASGNTSMSNVTVTVIDNIKPVITCPSPIEITLKALECSRKIDFAAATATDNCSAIVTQMSGLVSGSLFEAGTYKVTQRATDPSGNIADCSFDIKVNEYKAGGAMICLGSVNLSIGELCINKITPNMILLGNDYRCLNSYNVMLKDKNGRLVEDNFIRASNIGTQMTISVVDPKTGSSCWGNVNIYDKIPPTIQSPSDALVFCDEVDANGSPLSSLTGEPRIIYECSRTNTSYVDETIEINCSESFTTKPANFPSDLTFSVDKGFLSSKIIIRTFTVSDIYGNTTKCKQAIYIRKATLNNVSCPSPTTVSCVNGYQNLNPRDTTINGVTYRGTGEPKYSNGKSLNVGSCKIIAAYTDKRYTYINSGRTEIERTWLLLDCCTGEKVECVQIISLNDTKPTLVLKANQKFDLTVSKTVQVFDNQLINTVSDDCTANTNLQFGMRKKGTGSGFPTVRSLTFGCLDLGKFNVEIWVEDDLGNVETKEVEIQITDSNNNCNPIIPRIALSGSVTRENGDKITSLVTLYKNNDSLTTQSLADFNFKDLSTGANYRLKPVRNNDIFNGVTTFDISIISRYLLGIDSTNISTPARMIAADVNADGEINGADMIHIRNLILRKSSSFPNNKAWRFVSKNYVFLNPQAPFGEDFPEALNYVNLNQNITQANFTAIKVGDVNGTALSNFGGSNETTLNTRGTKPVLNIETEDIELKKGETKTLSFRLNDPSVSGLTAVQFALNFDKNKANIANLKQGEIANWTESNQNLVASEGVLATAWSSGKATRFDKNQTVFALSITAKEDLKLSEIARQNATFTEGIAYDAAGNELSIQLVFNSLGIKENNYKYSLLQNVPNPFTQETVIPFTMSKEDLATLTVFDATGKIVSITQRTFAKGYNEVVFKTPNLSNAGVYYYRLQTGEFSAVMRMILVK
jgi:hypothetical protein